jgi:hypothetical protein
VGRLAARSGTAATAASIAARVESIRDDDNDARASAMQLKCICRQTSQANGPFSASYTS